VIDNVEFGLKYRPDLKRRKWDGIARYFISLVGLDGFEDSYITQLSGGMQQRLAIARTLAADPKILLMDEPFGSLDTQNREFLQLQLLEAQQVARKTIVFITHDVEEAIFLADRLLILTARPARLKKEINIELPKPRTLEMKTSERFLTIKREVLDYTREEAAKTDKLWRRHPKERIEPLRDERKFSLRRHRKRK
jgi:ABC-type nitrate/sulfonate/bicarbonate transport system ATPase subunit